MKQVSPTFAAGIVLAAGTSSRMGQNKLLLPIGGEPIIRRVVREALAADLDPVIVVVGHQQERTTEALLGLSHQLVMHPGYEDGMTSSLRAGVEALPATTTAGLMILGDMPYVTSEMLRSLVEAHRRDRCPLVLSDYGGVLAPPNLFDRALLDQILELSNHHCPKRIIKRHRQQASTLRWSGEQIRDFDRPEDAVELLRLTAEKEGLAQGVE